MATTQRLREEFERLSQAQNSRQLTRAANRPQAEWVIDPNNPGGALIRDWNERHQGLHEYLEGWDSTERTPVELGRQRPVLHRLPAFIPPHLQQQPEQAPRLGEAPESEPGPSYQPIRPDSPQPATQQNAIEQEPEVNPQPNPEEPPADSPPVNPEPADPLPVEQQPSPESPTSPNEPFSPGSPEPIEDPVDPPDSPSSPPSNPDETVGEPVSPEPV